MTAVSTKPERAGWFTGTRASVRSAWEAPITSYYLILASTLTMLGVGLVFVLSSSTVYSIAKNEGNPFTDFVGQVMYAGIGLVFLLVISRLPVRLLRALAWPAMALAFGLQLLLFTPLAHASGGNKGWIFIGGFSVQPGEFVKVALALWLGSILATNRAGLVRLRSLLVPLAGVGVMAGIQLVEAGDLGTVLILAALVAGALWVAGLPLRIFAALGVAGASVLALFASVGTRWERIQAQFGMGELDENALGWQVQHSLQALGTGGISGVGLGGSRTKWLYLPAAQDDFILAVVGEELGLLGTLVVLILFAALLVGLSRVVARHPDPFAQITTGAICAWIGAQALINIGVVIGVFPVVGLPLPLFSAGGSSLIATMIALGIAASFARTEPGAAQALAARRGAVRRSFGVLGARLTGGRR